MYTTTISLNTIKIQEYDLSSDLFKSCELAIGKSQKQKDDNIISKKGKLVGKKITLMKRKKEEVINVLMPWTKMLKKCTLKWKKNGISISSWKETLSENSLRQTDNFKRLRQFYHKNGTIKKRIKLDFYIWRDSCFVCSALK